MSAERQAIETQYKRSKVGFPIRKSLDQSSFAAPQGLSQRTTSFIASQRQGIHRMLLRHLIASVIDVRSFVTRPLRIQRKNLTRSQKDQRQNRFRSRRRMLAEHNLQGTAFAALQATFPLHDVRRTLHAVDHRGSETLTTIRTAANRYPDRTPRHHRIKTRRPCSRTAPSPKRMVEPDGIEPTTSCLQSTRSPN